ncbi:MAG: hypothetical protein LH473_04420, partial [Chitinophagales bacterium]|nr:hypothetical protein [Chitinophagales bacterium]
NIVDEVKSVDVALIDATFYSNSELPGRSMSEVPHPLVTETIDLFKNENTSTKQKIFFIHCNHTNPLIWDDATRRKVFEMKFNIANQGQKL